MTRRKYSPLHDFWHPRVEGQIKHTIGRHPEWFKLENPTQKKFCINSLAKRIVGEIIAAGYVALSADAMTSNCEHLSGKDDGTTLSSTGGVGSLTDLPGCPWISVKQRLPSLIGKGAQRPLLVTYIPAKKKNTKVTWAVWTGKGFKLLAPQFRSAKSPRVTHWMRMPKPVRTNV